MPDDLASVTVGQDTRGSVRRKLGRPGSEALFSDDAWYYVSSTVEKYTYHEPKIVDRKVVAVGFDDAGVVQSVNTYGLEDGRVVDLETGITPTYGRQLTILEQAFANFGVVTEDDIVGNN